MPTVRFEEWRNAMQDLIDLHPDPKPECVERAQLLIFRASQPVPIGDDERAAWAAAGESVGLMAEAATVLARQSKFPTNERNHMKTNITILNNGGTAILVGAKGEPAFPINPGKFATVEGEVISVEPIAQEAHEEQKA